MSRMDSRDLAVERLAKFAYTTPQNNMKGAIHRECRSTSAT